MADKMICRATDVRFKPYGRLLPVSVEELSDLIAAAETLDMPEGDAKYEASLDVFERLPIGERFRDEFFGELPIEIGCCWGRNRQLGALEWHASSEINVAATDFTMFLGKLEEMQDGIYDGSNLTTFLIEKGQAVEIYGTTLHFCPCTDSPEGFRCVVILPRDTNLPLDRESMDPFLFRKNKWIVSHDDNETLKARGVRPGLFGDCYNPDS